MKSPLKYEKILQELPERQRIESEFEEKRRLQRNALTQQLMRDKKRNHEEQIQNLRLNEEKPVLNMIKRNSSVQFKLPQSKNY